MAKKKTLGKKKKTSVPVEDYSEEGLVGVEKALFGVAEELQPLYKIEDTNEKLNDIADALYELARAYQMGLIAQHGSKEEREIALKYWKDNFEGHFPK